MSHDTKKTRHAELSEEDFRAFQQGSQAAFRRVYDCYIDFAYYVALKLCRDPVRADDLVQDVFVKLMRCGKDLKGTSALSQWVAVAIRNAYLDDWRRNKKTVIGFADDVAEPSYRDANKSMAYEAEIQLVGDLLATFILEEDAVDLSKFYVEGWSVKQIATKNKESTSAVTTRLTRLRRKFREYYDSVKLIGTFKEKKCK